MVTQTEMANITDHDHPYQPAV